MTKTNYKIYHLSMLEYLKYGSLFFLCLAAITFLFYDSLIPILFFSPSIILYLRIIRKYLCEKRQSILLYEFRDFINALSASLNSGYSLENAVREAHKELIILYGKRSYMVQETDLMLKFLALNIPIEKIFADFANRCSCDDIITFSNILIIVKRNGGDLISIIKSSSTTISQKIALKSEVSTIIAAKRFEQNIMFLMPVAIMTYIRIVSKGYFDIVYHNVTGIIIMTCCIFFYLLSILLGLKMSKINIT